MQLFRFVLHVDDTLSMQTVVSPCPDLDAPRVILVLWRHFVPWTWRILAECNGHDTDTIVFLVRAISSSRETSSLTRLDNYLALLRC